MQPDLSVNNWAGVFQLLTSRQLSCSAAVSSGSAMGSMMQQVQMELQYISDSGMGSNTESSSAVDGGQQAKHQQQKIQLQDLVVHGVYALLEHTSC